MKTRIILIIILAFAAQTFNPAMATEKKEKPVTVSFWVAGVCGMCESTIEKALDVKGIINADYNLETHTLEVTYKPGKISEDQIHKLLNEVGYDTSKYTATDEQYQRTHECCRYREMTDH